MAHHNTGDPSSILNRRALLKTAALSPQALSVPAVAQAPRGAVVRPEPMDPRAGRWHTWLLPHAGAISVANPPLRASRNEIAELVALQRQRGTAAEAIVDRWDRQGGVQVWVDILLTRIRETSTNPVMASRALALMQTAISDAAVAVWNAKFRFNRPAPARLPGGPRPRTRVNRALPSYPSDHAAIAAAAATVLGYLYPSGTVMQDGRRMTFDALANEAAASRLWAGANYRSDVQAGFLLGEMIGRQAVKRGISDGSAATWDTTTQPGRPGVAPPYWIPTPPANTFPPLLPLTGFWNPWLMESGSQFRPAAPPPGLEAAYPSAAFLAACQEVKNVVDSLGTNPQLLTIAEFWADGGGTVTPPGHWAQFAAQHAAAAGQSAVRAARTLALQGVAVADAAISCWDTKYAYWLLRPITAIRTLEGQPFYDPAFLTPIATPPFPSYTSGHSTFSGCSARVLEHLFPNGFVTDALGQNVPFDTAAEQARDSRLYAGIHYRFDNDDGLAAGRSIADLVIARARQDAA